MATEEVAMGQAVPVRTDYTAGEVRRVAKWAKDAAQARRLLAIAAVLERFPIRLNRKALYLFLSDRIF
jgi:hypothetical protein